MKIFLDTNVLVSAFLGSQLCNELLSAVLGEHELVVSDLVVTEFEEVLRKKFQTTGTALKKAMAVVEKAEVYSLQATTGPAGITATNDLKIILTARDASVDFLVTGDHVMLAQALDFEVAAVTPRGFLQIESQPDDSYPFPSSDDESGVSEPQANPIKDKSFEFALRIIKLYQALQDQREYVLSKQILRSGTSIGANVEEATAAESRADFIHKMKISMKESRETCYWLRLLEQSDLIKDIDLSNLLSQANELSRMLTSITKTASENSRR